MNSTVVRVIKAALGVFVLVVLILVMSRWWGQYQQDSVQPAAPTTTTAPPQGEGSKSTAEGKKTAQAATKPKQVQILRSGVHFREGPSIADNLIRDFKKGEVVILVETKGDWYHVKDKSGQAGWVTGDKRYTKIR